MTFRGYAALLWAGVLFGSIRVQAQQEPGGIGGQGGKTAALCR